MKDTNVQNVTFKSNNPEIYRKWHILAQKSIEKKKLHSNMIEQKTGDMFAIADEATYKDFALAHCISEDCAMGKGIAVEFKKRYEGVPELKKQVADGKKTGFACVLKRNRPVYYLITKKAFYNKPTYDSLRKSLEDMRLSLIADKTPGVVMPKIGCGLDKLEWSNVLPMITEVFAETDIKVVICTR